MTSVLQIHSFSFVAVESKKMKLLKFSVYIQIPQRLWDKVTTVIKYKHYIQGF